MIDPATQKDSKFSLCIDNVCHLYIKTCKATHSHCDYNQHHSIIGVYYLCKLNFFDFEFETVNYPGFVPRSPGHKVAMLTIELHSIDSIGLYIIQHMFIKYTQTHFHSNFQTNIHFLDVPMWTMDACEERSRSLYVPQSTVS